ncbi:PH domain-containing protein [Clostridium gasigenes]|uniref:PH domain-containing protein n=1 Tax=Clostridium gasigenes TaxID=94869 RepID=A0A7X0SF32_9CLOT|nr:PH domain-containing protein [Clostridium gasigenes]MBB6716439.1 PH domain-containing protein [Clostridium gasigenes]
MFKELRKNHWIYIIENIIKLFREAYFLIILAFVNWRNEWWIYPGLGGGIVLVIIISIVNWNLVKFQVEGNSLIYNKGIIEKKKMKIPFDKITTIDIGISIFDRIFNTCSAKIDTGASKIKKSEIKLKIKMDEAKELKNIILKNNKAVDEEDIEIDNKDIIKKVITGKELLIYAITKGKLIGALGALFIVMQFMKQVEDGLSLPITEAIDSYVNMDGILGQSTATLILGGFGLLVVIYILITVIFILYENIRLYNYTIISDGINISISYGLLNKKEYALPIKKIHALRYKQGILQQILGIFTIEAITIGYGDEKNEKALIYPIANKKFIEEVINSLIPQLAFNGDVSKPPKKAIPLFITKTTLILAAIFVPIAIFISKMPIMLEIIVVLFILVGNIIFEYINYRNTSLGIGKETILATSGSLVKASIIIKQSSIQSITMRESPFKRKINVCNFVIDIYTNKFGEAVQVLNMDKNLKEDLYNNIIM